jgi:transposase
MERKEMPFEPKISPATKAKARELYEAGAHSCNEIGKQLEIPGSTVQTWARREGWIKPGIAPAKGIQRKAQVAIERKFESLVQRKAESLSERAIAFKRDAIDEGEMLLKEVKSLRERGIGDAETLQKTVSAYKGVVEAGWKIHGFENEQHQARNASIVQVVINTQDTSAFHEIEPVTSTPQSTIDVEASSSDAQSTGAEQG